MQWLYSNAMGGVRLMVDEDQAEVAADLLASDFSHCLADSEHGE